MKIEIGKDFPPHFKPAYPEEFELFSHFYLYNAWILIDFDIVS